MAGLVASDLPPDDVRYVQELGLVRASEQGLEIANPIYREVIPRGLATIRGNTPNP